MFSIFDKIRILGIRRSFKLYRAHRFGWKQIISGFFTTRTIQTLFNIGLFDEMTELKSVDINNFSKKNGLDLFILTALCDSLFCLRILKKNGSKYSLDTRGSLLVTTGRGWFEGTYAYEGVLHSLEPLLKKEVTYGKEVNRRTYYAAMGSGRMESVVFFPFAMEKIEKNKYSSVLDLGCGEGMFLRDLCIKNKNVKCYGVDMTENNIVKGTKKIEDANFKDRIKLICEDANNMDRIYDSIKDINVITSFFLLHEILYHGEEMVITLLKNIRKVFPKTPFLIFEVLRPTLDEMRKTPGMSVYYLLQHDLSHQKLVSKNEWLRIFNAAGFNSVHVEELKMFRTGIFTLE